MNRICAKVRWLTYGILVLLLFFTAVPAMAASPVNGGANSDELHSGYTNVVDIPVVIHNGGQAMIVPIDFYPGKTPPEELPEAHGTKTIPASENHILPSSPIISVEDGATGTFHFEFPLTGLSDNTLYSYKITQICDNPKKIYPDPDKTYYLDIYILYATPPGSAHDVMYAIPVLRYEDGTEAQRKPDKCEFENENKDLRPPIPKNAETWGYKGETQSSDKSSTGKILFEKGSGELISMKLIDPYTKQPTDKTTIDALDKNGKKIGTYTLASYDLATGEATIIFKPDPDFVGDPQPCAVQVEDEYDFVVVGYYQPHVIERSPTPSTGDLTVIWPYLVVIIVAAAAIIVLIIVRKKRNKDKDN